MAPPVPSSSVASVGNTVALGAIGITGNLDLDANIVGAASLAVSGSSNLGASVTTTGNQTYTGAVTLSADVTLTTTNNGDVSFSNVVDGDYDLQVSTHGTGDTTFAQAVGANTALNNITITTDEFTAAAIKADGTFSLTNLTASTISGILSETSALALTKAGVGNLTLTAVHTFTGDTTISAGDVIVGGSGQLGSGSYGGAISLASGSTLSFGSSVSQTLSGVISGDGDVEKVTSAASTLTLSGDNTYTGGTNVSAGYLQSGSSSGASPPTSGPFGTATVTVASGAVLDVNGQTVGNAINLSGTGISENGALINSHATAATISGDITLAAHTSVGGAHAVTLSGAISGTGINFTKVGASTYTLSNTNTYTGDTTISAGTLKLTGNLNSATNLVIAPSATLDLQAALTAATLDLDGTISNTAGTSSLIISGTANLGGSITTTGTQTYSGAVTLSAATITLTTTDSDVTFGGTIDSDAGQTNHLTIDTNGTTGTIQFGGLVGNTVALGAIGITGNLDLDANIVGAASLAVSGSSNLGASVTTTGNQTYTGAVTLSADVTLTTTNNGDVSFSNVVDGDYDLQVSTHGTGDTTFAQAVGANTALNNITITTDEFTAAAIKADGTFSLTNLTASTISGILSETSALALTKAGVGNLTLTAVHTFTGDTTISAGDVIVGGSGQLGSGSYGGAISLASGSTLSFGSSVSQTLSGVISGDGDVEKVTSAASTLTLSGDNTYTGGTNVSAGYLQSGSSSGASPPTSGPFGTATVTVASGAVLDVNGQTVGNAINLSGTGISENGALINSHATAATISGDITLAAHTSVGGAHAVTLSGAISGTGINFTKVGASTYTLSNTNTYTGDTTISAGTLKLTGNLNSATNLVIAPSATLDLQAALTAATLDLDGTISNTAGTSSLIISGTSSLGGSITTTGTQTYNNAVTLTGDTTLATSSAQVTFAANATINSEGSETNNLTITASETELNGVIGYTRTLGVIDINGNLDLNAAITNATSMDVSGTANLGADVTTTGTQTYTGAVTISTDAITLTTTNNQITFSSTVNSAASAAHAINFNVGNAEVEFDGIVGGADNGDLGAIGITGNLDLDANIVGAASLAVSGTSNLGANVTTSGNQTYTGDITLSADVGLNTSGGDVQIDGDVNTALVSGGSESGIIQFLGNGSYQYSADGGSIYTTATATSSATTLGTGSLTYSGGSYSWTTPSGVTSTKLLVVGGGGSGGSSFAGAGGGAGGYVYHESYSLSLASNYSIAVGDGGTAASTHETAGRNGSSSVFGTVVAYGGGGGGTAFGVVPPLCPAGGCGSSGGAGWNVDSSNIRSASQGNIGSAYQPSSHGCSGSTCNGNSGGAGGGAGAPGQLNGSAVALTSNSNAPAGYYSTAPTGGVGLTNDITGSSTYYAGGGGSGSDGLGGNGGLGGGGNGGSGVAAPSGYHTY